MDKTQKYLTSAIFLWYENGCRRILGAQSIILRGSFKRYSLRPIDNTVSESPSYLVSILIYLTRIPEWARKYYLHTFLKCLPFPGCGLLFSIKGVASICPIARKGNSAESLEHTSFSLPVSYKENRWAEWRQLLYWIETFSKSAANDCEPNVNSSLSL